MGQPAPTTALPPSVRARFGKMRRDAARFRLPSHTDEQVRVLGIEANEHGATLTIAAAWAGRFDCVADAAAFAEALMERGNG